MDGWMNRYVCRLLVRDKGKERLHHFNSKLDHKFNSNAWSSNSKNKHMHRFNNQKHDNLILKWKTSTVQMQALELVNPEESSGRQRCEAAEGQVQLKTWWWGWGGWWWWGWWGWGWGGWGGWKGWGGIIIDDGGIVVKKIKEITWVSWRKWEKEEDGDDDDDRKHQQW